MLNRDVNERMNSLQKELDMMRSKSEFYISMVVCAYVCSLTCISLIQ